MNVTEVQRRLLELCAIRVEQASVDWSLIARQAQFDGGLEDLWRGVTSEKSAAAKRSAIALRRGLRDPASLARKVEAELEAAAQAGARLITVLDQEYPANLRLIPNLPPFLFYLGELRDADALAVAVVGTRTASDDGLCRAARMSRLLAGHGVTVVSGLAKGIDTAAHDAALTSGGRTIAVLGTGITQCYPEQNRDLARKITTGGALVSQFWPSLPPRKDGFPRRNVVTSGLSQGTVVIEASNTSGARMQARIALDHGKQVFLLKSLVTGQPWARDYVDNRGAIEVSDVDEVITRLAPPERIMQATAQQQQLSLMPL